MALTCYCNQGTKELDQGQHEGNAKITRKREEERITVCLHRMLEGKGRIKGHLTNVMKQ